MLRIAEFHSERCNYMADDETINPLVADLVTELVRMCARLTDTHLRVEALTEVLIRRGVFSAAEYKGALSEVGRRASARHQLALLERVQNDSLREVGQLMMKRIDRVGQPRPFNSDDS